MFKTLSPYLKLYRYHFIWLFVGLLLAILTISASIGLLTLSGWFLAGSAIAGAVAFTTFNYLLPAAFVRGFAISRTAFRYFERVVTHEATFRVLAKLRVNTFQMIFPRYHQLVTHYKQADLLNRLVTDVETLDNLYLRVITPLVSALVVSLGITFILSFFNLSLALLLGGMLALVLVTLPPLFYTLSKPVGKKLAQSRSSYREELNRFLQGQTLLLIYNKWHKGLTHLDMIDNDKMKNEKQHAFYHQLGSVTVLLISGIAVCVMIYFAGDWVVSTPIDSLATKPQENALFNEVTYTHNVVFSAYAALFVFATLAAFEMMVPVSHSFTHLGLVLASAKRLNEIQELSPLVHYNSSAPVIVLNGDESPIEIENLDFIYPNQINPVLINTNLTVKPLEKIAIIGATGSGKSTLLDLIMRKYDSEVGQIKLFGQNIRHFSESKLRSLITVVPQSVYLFNDTLRENLLIGSNSKNKLESKQDNSRHSVDDNALISILSDVGLAYLADNNGLNQIMGDGGRSLSGGELRRIGIARALIHDSALWLLDEPTEGLDSETENQILELIFNVTADKTLLMVTHRTTQIERFTKLIEVKDQQLNLIKKYEYTD